MGVNVIGKRTGRGSPEMWEELMLGIEGDDREGEFLEDGGGWGGRRNDSDGGFDNGRWEVLNWDVCEWDAVDDVLKLKVNISILGFIGGGILKLQA